MTRFGFFLIAMLVCSAAIAQKKDQQYIVSEGMSPKDVLTFTDIYLYPSFTSGKVNFKNQRIVSCLMNYNRFTSEIDFIKGKDTLALAEAPGTLKNITIGNDMFYYHVDAGYVQRLAETAYAILAKRETIQLADRRRRPNSAGASSTSNGSYNNMANTGGDGITSGLSLKMVEKVNLIYRQKTEYYFANTKGLFLKADKKNLLRLYHDKKAALEAYLEAHTVDFENEESLQNLFKVINELH